MSLSEIRILAFQTRRMSYDEAIGYLERTLTEALSSNDHDIVVLPEKWVNDIMDSESEKLIRILDFFRDLSQRHGSIIVPGSFSVSRDGELFNSAPVIYSGKVLGWQDKISLFRKEKDSYTSGKEAMLFDSGEMKFGVSVCYDSDFPYYSRIAAIKGAEMMINPALIHGDFHDMWKIYIEARSLENRLPFISINSLSEPFRGGSMISVPTRYMFGAKLSTESYGNSETIRRTISIEGLREMRRERIDEDPGTYAFR